jgi:heterodisulfide reductase subunit A2
MGEVIVIGGGITGIQAALDIANHGIRVHLIEREPSIGGHMAQLDKTFPTNDCSMCILSPKMVEVERHPLITLHTCSEVEKVEGKAGRFIVTVKTYPRYIDEERCNGCGDCILICPVEVYNRFDAGIGVRKAIYKPHQQAVPDVVIKDNEHCIECGLCYGVCGTEAIKKEDDTRITRIQAASIVVSCGYMTFDAVHKPQFRYGDLPDVITSLELERMISASGPTGGQLKRLSTGVTPRRVLFIQCVGSRDLPLDRPFCSGICCMSAIKNAMLIREHYPDVEVTVCYMDIRAYGKGYEEYYERAKEAGIRFLRGMPSEIAGDALSMHVQVENTETGEVIMLQPDLVVLSVGLRPADDAVSICEKLGIPLEDTGFIQSLDAKINTVATIRPGIYIAGTAVAPKDIPDCVAHAGAAAMRAFMDANREG